MTNPIPWVFCSRSRSASSIVVRHRSGREGLLQFSIQHTAQRWRVDVTAAEDDADPFASQALADRVTSCVVQREVGTSDHGPVVAVFDV